MIATGQITIIDYNDAITLTGFISSNHPKTQTYNPDNETYVPNWESSNLVLTPSLYKLGTTSDIITSADVTAVKWYSVSAGEENEISANTEYGLSGAKNHILTVKKNLLKTANAVDIVCKVVFTDPGTKLELIHKMSITFNKVSNGGGITDCICHADNGNVFKNSEVVSLVASCDLYRGAKVDREDVEYQWYIQDPLVESDEGAGEGWGKLDGTTNYGITGYTTRQITIPASAVKSYEVFKAVIKDTDASSGTYNQSFFDTISFIDNSDPIQISIVSSGGDIFKNGQGETTLTARVFRAGEEIDSAGSAYEYRWFKYDSNASLDEDFGGTTAYKTGKTLRVTSADVDTKATFSLELYEKSEE